MTGRRGFTLIELIVVIMASTLMLGLCVGLIHILVKLDRAGHVQLNQHASLARLARAFRGDVRAAIAVDPAAPSAGPGQRLVLKRPDDRAVEYRIEANALIRTERDGDKVRNQDAFPIPRRDAARIDVRSLETQTVVGLSFEARSDKKDAGSLRGYRVESVLGQDHRFEAKGK